jgi:hypothetical protein
MWLTCESIASLSHFNTLNPTLWKEQLCLESLKILRGMHYQQLQNPLYFVLVGPLLV